MNEPTDKVVNINTSQPQRVTIKKWSKRFLWGLAFLVGVLIVSILGAVLLFTGAGLDVVSMNTKVSNPNSSVFLLMRGVVYLATIGFLVQKLLKENLLNQSWTAPKLFLGGLVIALFFEILFVQRSLSKLIDGVI